MRQIPDITEFRKRLLSNPVLSGVFVFVFGLISWAVALTPIWILMRVSRFGDSWFEVKRFFLPIVFSLLYVSALLAIQLSWRKHRQRTGKRALEP